MYVCRLGQCCLELHCGNAFGGTNRPFLSCPKPLFQSEAQCEAIDDFYSHANKTRHFQKKGFALSLVLQARYF